MRARECVCMCVYVLVRDADGYGEQLQKRDGMCVHVSVFVCMCVYVLEWGW